jgi:hypothetical protein
MLRDGECPEGCPSQRKALGPSDVTACSAAPDDFEERMMEMDIHELRSRILTQRDYLKKMHSCLDGLKIPADCITNIDGCRDHHDIRWIVKKLISRLPNAEVCQPEGGKKL